MRSATSVMCFVVLMLRQYSCRAARGPFLLYFNRSQSFIRRRGFILLCIYIYIYIHMHFAIFFFLLFFCSAARGDYLFTSGRAHVDFFFRIHIFSLSSQDTPDLAAFSTRIWTFVPLLSVVLFFPSSSPSLFDLAEYLYFIPVKRLFWGFLFF